MTNRSSWVRLPLAFLCTLHLALFCALPAGAQSSGEMLIDISGSMSRNDPDQLRWDGILTFTNLLALGSDNELGVSYFSDVDRVQVQRTAVTRATYPRFEKLASDGARSDGKTDLVPSFERATRELEALPGRRYVVIVSDGIFGRDERLRHAGTRFRDAGGVVYFVRITPEGAGDDKTNSALVELCEASGGEVFQISTRGAGAGEEALRVFLEIYMRASPASLTLLTDEDGRFRLSPAHRSFVAVDPRGRRLRLEDPTGRVGDDLGIELRNWNVVGRERPARTVEARVWSGGSWKLVSVADGRPAAGARVYVKSDVSLTSASGARAVAAEGLASDLVFEVGLEGLATWFDGAGSEEYLGGLELEYTLARPDAATFAETVGLLGRRDGRRFSGALPTTLGRGEYALTVEARHRDDPGTRLARERISLRVEPTYLRAAASVVSRADEDLADEDGAPEPVLFVGEELRYELEFLDEGLRAADDAAADTSTRRTLRVGAATLTLSRRDDGFVRSYNLTRQVTDAAADRVVYVSSPLPAEEAGVFEAHLTVTGERVHEREDELGVAASRSEPFRDTIVAPGFRVRAPTIRAAWNRDLSVFAPAERVRWEAELLVDGPPATLAALGDALERRGVAVLLTGRDARLDSRAQPELFALERPVLDPDRSLARLGGACLAPQKPGRYELELILGDLLEDPAFATFDRDALDRRSITVRGRPVELALRTRRGGEESLLHLTEPDDLESFEVELWADQPLLVQLVPGGGIALAEDPGLVRLEDAFDAEVRTLALEGSRTSYALAPGALAPGLHDLRLSVDMSGPGGESVAGTVEHHFRVRVRDVPAPHLRWIVPPRARYWQHELAEVVAEVSFPGGGGAEVADWSASVALSGGASLAFDSLAAESVETSTAAGARVFRAEIATATCAEREHRIELTRGDLASTAVTPFAYEVAPLVIFRVDQAGELLASSRDSATLAGRLDLPLELSVQVVEGSAQAEPARVRAVDAAGIPRGSDILLAAGEDHALSLADAGDGAEHTFAWSGTFAGPDGEPRHLRWTSPPVQLRRRPWAQRPLGRTVIYGGGGLLALLLLLAWWVRPDVPLPTLRGRVTRVSPDYAAIEFSSREGALSRLLARGRRGRVVRIGPGERIDFGATPLEELGLDPTAKIEFELVGGADLGRDGERYLVLRGENRGSTLLVVDGHMHAVFPGDDRAELCLDGISPPIVLELTAGALSMQVQIELDGTPDDPV